MWALVECDGICVAIAICMLLKKKLNGFQTQMREESRAQPDNPEYCDPKLALTPADFVAYLESDFVKQIRKNMALPPSQLGYFDKMNIRNHIFVLYNHPCPRTAATTNLYVHMRFCVDPTHGFRVKIKI